LHIISEILKKRRNSRKCNTTIRFLQEFPATIRHYFRRYGQIGNVKAFSWKAGSVEYQVSLSPPRMKERLLALGGITRKYSLRSAGKHLCKKLSSLYDGRKRSANRFIIHRLCTPEGANTKMMKE
jgi:hypothetical protein